MRRREFVVLVIGMTAGCPFAARAQQPLKRPTIGFLVAGTPSSHRRWVDAFVQRLGELGWIDGRNIGIEYRWAEGRTERATDIATELVGRNCLSAHAAGECARRLRIGVPGEGGPKVEDMQ